MCIQSFIIMKVVMHGTKNGYIIIPVISYSLVPRPILLSQFSPLKFWETLYAYLRTRISRKNDATSRALCPTSPEKRWTSFESTSRR